MSPRGGGGGGGSVLKRSSRSKGSGFMELKLCLQSKQLLDCVFTGGLGKA